MNKYQSLWNRGKIGGLKSVKVRFEGMTPQEISAYMSKVRRREVINRCLTEIKEEYPQEAKTPIK